MNVPLIKMDRDEAREQLRAYRAQLHKRADAEYEAVAKGLAALADGTPIISLTAALNATGVGKDGRPRLAIARADRRQVEFTWSGNDAVFDTANSFGRRTPSLTVSVTVDRPGRPPDWWGRPRLGYSLVPMVPAQVREAVRFADRHTYILWEVEHWSETPRRAWPDRDPYLLRHLHGDAYVVLAEWDLTPLEQLVMARRRA